MAKKTTFVVFINTLYTDIMNILTKATSAKKPKTKDQIITRILIKRPIKIKERKF